MLRIHFYFILLMINISFYQIAIINVTYLLLFHFVNATNEYLSNYSIKVICSTILLLSLMMNVMFYPIITPLLLMIYFNFHSSL